MAASSIKTFLTIDGIPELQAALKAMRGSDINRAVRYASKKAIAPVVKSMKTNAPRETGLLRRYISWKQKTYKNGTTVTLAGPRKRHGLKQRVSVKKNINGKRFTVSQARNPEMYAHLVEGGTRPHSLGSGTSLGKASREFKALTDRGRSWKKTRWTKAIAKHQRGAMHPGTKAQPFVLPAYQKNKVQMLRIYRNELWVGIEKAATRRAKKTVSRRAA